MPKCYLDLPPCGIGNIVLKLAGFRAWVAARGGGDGPGEWPPVVLCHRPDDLSGIRADAFRLVREPPAGAVAVPDGPFCNLGMLCERVVAEAMRDIVVPLDDVLDADCDAAFCIRVSDDAHDGGAKFMNGAATAAMRAEMADFDKVLVFSNDAAHLGDLPANAVAYARTDPAERNTPAHWRQWHALSRAPVVYHGVSSGADGSITSTFGPTAAVYGGGTVVGVDNDGTLLRGPAYRW